MSTSDATDFMRMKDGAVAPDGLARALRRGVRSWCCDRVDCSLYSRKLQEGTIVSRLETAIVVVYVKLCTANRTLLESACVVFET